ncbi:tyrosine-type recombinase/integrase [Deinococcus budaensis]|uniref:Site-specific recombinase XerD n=1 Tax=Deinococcus budaensis TaxID=1665626 RepID=A0A7W8GE68_9DEIO|nr:integrase [Deinococcus budaensis]MBB5234002.1 site-specific recombinase XerD [Deinococcus budaensis]
MSQEASPGPDARVLRRLLEREDLDGFVDAVAPLLPGQAGDRTRQNNVSGVRIYLKWCAAQGHPVLHPSDAQAAAYRSWLEAHHAPATSKNRLSQVRHLYDALGRCGVTQEQPFRGVRGPVNRPEEHRDHYSAAELTRLLTHANTEERALVLLGAHGGLTGPEVLELRFEALRLWQGDLEVGGRVIPGSAELLEALARWGHQRGHTALFSAQGPVFDLASAFLLRQRIFRLCRRANVPYRAWQALRNAAGLRLLGLVEREEAQAQLGLAGSESLRPLVKLSGQPQRRRGPKRRGEHREEEGPQAAPGHPRGAEGQ